ncbi:uncharacterized protein LOC135100863 [Scylla paramamosain]|uniref:uncharacterized protein LOC135100863 n=1 Tax=Scylla paramamosain TaxID=85552 RepID=UPI0030838DB6
MRFLLLPLLRRARSVVPEPYLPYTPLLLRATPSLRRLPRVYATRLIYRARKIVARTAFLVKREEVTIMAGHDEAADLWLAANFLTGRLYQNDSLPFATANLGGGTLQVTIPLPGQPEHIKRTISQRRKGGGVNQSGDRNKEHGGGGTGSSAHQGGKQDARGVDLTAASKNTHRWKTSDKATSDNRSSGGGGSGGDGGGGGRAGGTRTRGRGRGGMRGGFTVYKGSQSQSEHVQKRGRVGASTRHRDTSGSAQTPRRESERRNSWKRFRGPFMKPRNRAVNPSQRVNNSVVIVPQNASDRSGAGEKKLLKENSEPNRAFRAQDTEWEGNSRRETTDTRRDTEENKARQRNDNVSGSRGRETHGNQEGKFKDNNSPGSKSGTRKGDKKNEESQVGEQTEEKHRHGHGKGRTPVVGNTKGSIVNAEGPTRTQISRKGDKLNTETQRTKSTIGSTLNHTSNADKRVTLEGSSNKRLDLLASRSRRLRPPRRRKHPRRHRQRNQKKPTRRKGSNSNNSTQSEHRNEKSNLSGQQQQQQSSLASLSPSLPAEGLPGPARKQNTHRKSRREDTEPRQDATSERTSSDHEHHQNRSHVSPVQTTHPAEAQTHGHRSVLREGQRKDNVTRRRNLRTQDKGNKSITTNSQTTPREKISVSKSSSSKVTDSFTPDKTANENLANGSGEIDKRGEEVGGGGARGTVTSHRERETNEKVMKNSHNTTLQESRDREKTSASTTGNHSQRRRGRRKFSSKRRRKAWSLRRKRLEQQRNLLHNKGNTTHITSVLGASLSDNPHEANKTQSVEESRRADRREAERLSVREMTDSPLPQVSGNRQVNNKIHQHTTRFDPSFSSSDTQTSPPATAFPFPERKNQPRLMSRRDRRRQRQRTARVQSGATASKHASLRVNAHVAENQSQDTYQRNRSENLQNVQKQTSHRQRHNHGGRRRHRRRYRRRRRRRYQRKEDVRGRRSVEEVRHNALYGPNRLLPPGEERESVRWRKNDQRNRRELADPFLVVGDWRGSLRRSYFGTPFPWQNARERWRRLMPRRDTEKSSQSGAGNFWQSVRSEEPVDSPLRTEIRGSSGKEFQKASRFLRRRRSVSKLAWETKAKMKAKRQNLAAALSQRCGRTGAGLLRSCGEPEMNCQPGEGDPRQAEMVDGKCDHLSLAGNQSASAEREPLPGKDRSPKRYLQQVGDTALVMVTDGGGENGGGYQRTRRELRNLSGTPNVTYRCSPSHKYWLFASSMPMGLYPLRVKILQSGNLTRVVPTSQDSRPLETTNVSPPTTQPPPTPATPHHRSDIPPEEEDYIGEDEEEDPSQYSGNPSTPSTIQPTHPTTFVHSTPPSTTQQPPPPSRPPYTTVRVTNKWVEETLAKVKTVVDSILKSIGSARSNVEENNGKKTPDQDGVNGNKEGSEKRMERRKGVKGEREGGSSRSEDGEKGKERNSEGQGQARDDRERGTRKEGIEMGRLGKKRSRERNRKGKSEGNRKRTERRESQITLESSEDQEADGREGERNGRGENTESLRNEHNNRERRKHGRRRNAARNKTENNRSFLDSGNGGSESEFSNNTVSQESDRIPGTWKQKAGGASISPPNRVSEVSGADESVSGSEPEGGEDAAARNTEFGVETETLPEPLSVVSQGEGIARVEGERHSGKKGEGTNYSPATNVRTESPVTSFPRDNGTRVNYGDEHVMTLEASTSLPTRISSSIDSGNNGNDTTGNSGAPASKQTISSVTDLLFTVPNERVIKPAQNSQVQSEIKSTEKLIRTSLEGLLFRVPPGGTTSTSKQSQEEKSSLKTSEGSQTVTATTAVPDATTPMREVTRPDGTEAPSVDAETIVTDSKPAHRQRSEERRRKKIAGAEGTQDTVYQRLNATENESRQPNRAEEKEEEQKQEEEGDLILRTACLPVGSIGRFKVEGVTYLVTGMGAGPGAEDCWREVTNVVNRHIRLPALNQTTLLATTAFYFVAASANLIEPEMTYGFVRVEQFRLAANLMCAREPRLLPDPLACLDYQYVAALLTQGLHLSDDTEVLVCDKIQGFRVGWALGAALDYLQNH